jgi:hypothetical protein
MWWRKSHKSAAAALGLLATLAGCTDEAGPPALPPPVAGLSHPQVVRLGSPAALSGASSAVATISGRPDLSARLVRYRFEVADGSEVADRGTADWNHVFDRTGSFALALTVEDDRGQRSTVQSRIQVVADLADACTGTVDLGCPSGLCGNGTCTVVACAGDAACPKAWFGDQALCRDGLCRRKDQP